tara:strand:+ start:1990 stop:3093 length:1104 start_codon:yes stop_codon:yes gene_type:complete
MGHGTSADWRSAVRTALNSAGIPERGANVGFLYVTDHFAGAMDEIQAELQALTGIETWVGTTGIGICATGIEYFDEPAIALLAGSVPDDMHNVIDTGTATPDEACAKLAGALGTREGRFGIIHADPHNTYLADLVPAVVEATGAFLVGGLTSSRGEHPQIAGGMTSGGISGVLFEPDVAVATGLTQGCSPIGPAHEVTDCQENIIIALDERPALEVLKEDIGEVLARDLGRIGGYIYVAFPVSGMDRPDYLVRNLVAIDPSAEVFAVGAEVSEGDTVMFCRRDGQAAHVDLKRMLSDLASRVGESTPKGGIYHSCLARGPNLFGPNSEELRTIQEALGDVPVVGMFCNGEISHQRLYGYTGVLSLFL